MKYIKVTRDWLLKLVLGSISTVPRGLVELNKYFRLFGPINFEYKKEDDNVIVAISTNYKYGTIITSAKNLRELDQKIKDAILTSFEVPSSYAQEAKIVKQGAENKQYALA